MVFPCMKYFPYMKEHRQEGIDTMDDMKILCAYIVKMIDDYSEGMIEDGKLTLSFDYNEYHFECTIDRTIREGD